MIKVDKNFYESGCIMEGKGNRVILKGKDGNGRIEMIFRKDEVQVWATRGLLNTIIPFKYIEEICTVEEKLTGRIFPAIKIKD